ncbi:MAG: hypothetical protein L6R00_06835 [Phycisphaerae bacterium]|nr:hypothetical protein [Phycisphaerae bacterium]
MPVDFLPDTSAGDSYDAPDVTAAALREAAMVAVRTAALCTAAAVPVVLLAIYALRDALLAADAVLRASQDWVQAFGPSVLFAIFGLIFGGAVGLLVGRQSGLAGLLLWAIGVGAAVALAAVAAVEAAMIFERIPAMCWIGLGAMIGGAMLALSYFAFWSES